MKLGFGVFVVLCVSTIAAEAGPDKAVLGPAFSAQPSELLAAAARASA